MKFKEDFIQYVWQHSLFNFLHLNTIDGERVTIIKPGNLNTNSGPDFENAKIKIGSFVHVGHVEIHINGNEWVNHKHHTNPEYNNVILHVCYTNGQKALRQDNTSAPCIELKEHIAQSTIDRHLDFNTSEKPVPCYGLLNKISAFDLENWMSRLLVERYEHKTRFIDEELQRTKNWNQSAFALLIKCFSTPVNSEAFIELSKHIRIEVLLSKSDNLLKLEALLLGTANLIEGDSEYAAKLRKEFALLQLKYEIKPIEVKIRKARMRPSSQPSLRLAQLAALIHKHHHIISAILDLSTKEEALAFFDVTPSKFWETHYTFSSKKIKKPKPFSHQFIEQFVTNCVVPLQFYYHKTKQHIGAFEKLELPYLMKPENNHITRKMVGAGFQNNSAGNSQSLIHLNKTYCSKRRCLHCRIGKTLISLN